jgi:serine/threonine-protein kinase
MTSPHSVERSLPESGGSTVTGTEEGRAFFQARLSTFGFCMLLLAGGTWLVSALAFLAVGGEYHPFSPSGIMHVTPGLLGGALWLSTRSGRRSGAVLHVFDVTGSLLIIAIMIAGGGVSPNPIFAVFIALLCFITGVLTRAIVVPSTARRTFWIAIVNTAVVVAIAVFRSSSPAQAIGGAVMALCWSSVGVAMGTVASHTIFGLRREVQKAKVLGQYTLEAKIGEGGMGQVWRASHTLLRRPTAIKLLPPGRMGERAIQRFEREVQLTASLTDPHTVAIYDYGRTRDGIFYYAMELLEGTDLERLVTEHGAQPPERVVHILVQVCTALAEAHDRGLVHRDVKPANILLSPRHLEHEFVKVVDFGLVKTIEAQSSDDGVTGLNTITGTPLYMAPEAIQAPETVDARTDLYAVGVVAWFLLMGRPLFEGRTIVEVCSHHLHTPPPRPSTRESATPPDLEAIVLACLEKDPAKRPPDARALRERLRASSVAGKWTAERAMAWWSERAPSRRVSASPPRTIELDAAARGA